MDILYIITIDYIIEYYISNGITLLIQLVSIVNEVIIYS